MGDHLDPGRMDMFVGVNEMGSNDCSKKLRRGDRMLLSHDIDGVLHGICRHDDAIICFGVSVSFQQGFRCYIDRYLRGLDISFQEHTHCHLYDSLDSCLCILVDFVDPDVVFAILGCGNFRHDFLQMGSDR